MPTILQNRFVLAVHNLEAEAQFFKDLGFKEIVRPQGWIFVGKDNCMIMLGECPETLPASELGDHSFFAYLRVDDVEGYYAEANAKGVKICSPIEDKPWKMREFGVISPEGHRM